LWKPTCFDPAALAGQHVSRHCAPFDQLHTVAPATQVIAALETMGRDDVNQLPLVSGNHLDGIITRANVLQFLQTRTELGR
jgi:predicted transcriptional regulator